MHSATGQSRIPLLPVTVIGKVAGLAKNPSQERA